MLQSMRELAHSWVVKGLMLFLIISFSIWGIGDIFRGNPLQKTVAKAGSNSISVEELNHLFEQTLAQARQRVAPDLTAQQARQMGLLDKTLDDAITRSLVDQDIKRMGIDVPQQAVLKLVSEQPQFRTKDGAFNKALFEQMLQQQRLSEGAFITQGQQDLSRQILLGALTGSHSVPQMVVDALYKARAQKRVLDVVTIDASKLTGIDTPDDKALHDFYDKNASLFTAPEYRGLTIAVLSADDVAKDVQITDEQVQKEYDDKSAELTHDEQRDILQVVVQDEAKAKALAVAARTSGLTNAAKAEKETAIPLDQLEAKNLMPELSKVVFALKEGEVSEPVKTQLGWHVIQVKKVIPAGKPELTAIKDKLREDMRRDQSIEATTRVVNQLDDQLAAGHSLDDIADGLRLRLIKIPAVDATGLTPDGKEPTELPNKDQMLKDAFGQNSGETSPIEDDKAGHYYVVRTDDVTPSAAKPFDTIKDKVTAAWKAHEQMMKAQSLAQSISKDMEAGKPLSSFAGEGITVRTSMPLSELGDTDPLLPSEIVTQAFKLKKGQAAQAAEAGKETIARLASITDIDASQADPRKNKVEGDIKQATNNELLEQYIQHLHQTFPVKVDRALLERMRQQDN